MLTCISKGFYAYWGLPMKALLIKTLLRIYVIPRDKESILKLKTDYFTILGRIIENAYIYRPICIRQYSLWPTITTTIPVYKGYYTIWIFTTLNIKENWQRYGYEVIDLIP